MPKIGAKMSNQSPIQTYDLQEIYSNYFNDNNSSQSWSQWDNDIPTSGWPTTGECICTIRSIKDIPGLEDRIKALIKFEIQKHIEDTERDFFGF